MLDRVRAGAQRIVDPAGAVRVHRHLHPKRMRRFDQRAHLGQIILLRADRIGARQHAAGAAELDDLRPVLAQPAHQRADRLRPVGHRRRRQHRRHRRRQPFGIVAMPAGGPDRIGGGHDPRPGHIAAVDPLLQRDIVIIAGTDVADGGEARLQHRAGIVDAHDRPEAIGAPEPFDRGDRGIPGQVDMHVDQPGQQRVIAQRDPFRAGRDRWLRAAGDDRDDPPVRHRHHGRVQHPPARHIQHPGRRHHHGVRHRRPRHAQRRRRHQSRHHPHHDPLVRRHRHRAGSDRAGQRAPDQSCNGSWPQFISE